MDSLFTKAIEEFEKLDNKPIGIIAHLDADGISSAAILTKALVRKNKKFVLRVVKQLDEDILKEISQEEYKDFIFADLGSGYIDLINKYLSGKKIFILDHHVPKDLKDETIIHVNPHLINVEDASNTISGSGIAYLFCKGLDKQNLDLAYIALIGAVGDMQEFKGMNGLILKDGINSGKLEIKKGLKMFGFQTRPLAKVLMYSTDIYIPGITGNENAAVNFLNELGINLKENGNYRTLADLKQDEIQKLVAGIIIKRNETEKNPEDIIGDIYLLKGEHDILKDIKEFSTLLNSCGRMNKPSLGVGLFFNNSDIRNEAIEMLSNYKAEIMNSLEWFFYNKERFVGGDKFVIINAGENIMETIIGTLCSIIIKSKVYPTEKIIIGMAYTLNNKIKISARASSKFNIDLREILIQIVGEGFTVGGHKYACGALIDLNEEERFIKRASEILTKVL